MRPDVDGRLARFDLLAAAAAAAAAHADVEPASLQ
jgi:hypothetical protein